MFTDKQAGNHHINTRIVILTLFIICTCSSAYSQVIDAWAVGDGEKIFRNDDNNPARKGNSSGMEML